MIPQPSDHPTAQAEHPLVTRFRAAALALPPMLLGHTARVVSEARRLGALYDPVPQRNRSRSPRRCRLGA